MCKAAVNNAQFYIELITGTGHFDVDEATQNVAIQRFVFLQGMYGMSWDKPEWTVYQEHMGELILNRTQE